MTAEISILNKTAVALAADSAVTLPSSSSQKIYNTVNKLFNLNKKYPIGIMLYGAANILTIPWETIIKVYRSDLGNKQFDTIREQAEDFIAYVNANSGWFPEELQHDYFDYRVKTIFNILNKEIVSKCEEIIDQGKEGVDTELIKQIVLDSIKRCYDYFKGRNYLGTYSDTECKTLQDLEEENILRIRKEIFQELPIAAEQLTQLKYIAICATIKDHFSSSSLSGIVITGFGRIELFPSIATYAIDNVFENKLRYKLISLTDITSTQASLIVPFAQTDMATTFLEGINPLYKKSMIKGFDVATEKYNSELDEILKGNLTNPKEIKDLSSKLKTFNKQLFTDLIDDLQKHAQDEHVNPILDSVSALPKEELAIMAESLVYLTYLKRRFSEEPETVGGDIDVAIITKGDGYIWIKRKHYFKAELNPQFFNNYFK